MIGKVAGELLLALAFAHMTTADASLFMPTFVSAANPHVEGFIFSQHVAHLPKAEERVLVPKKHDLTAVGVETSAPSVMVMDADSGAMLYAEDPDAVRAIGSISKLMTAMVFLDTNPDLDAWVTLTQNDYVGGGRVYLAYHDAVRLGDVLTASLVGSDNTATQALVRFSGLGEDAFIARMNEKAHELGLSFTTFADPSGLAGENQSTAREVSVLLAHAIEYDAIVARAQRSDAVVTHASGLSVRIDSTNTLLDSTFLQDTFSLVAGKTGYIPQAGYCFTGAFVHQGHTMFTTVLGAPTKEDRFTDAANVTDWVTQVYTWPAAL